MFQLSGTSLASAGKAALIFGNLAARLEATPFQNRSRLSFPQPLNSCPSLF